MKIYWGMSLTMLTLAAGCGAPTTTTPTQAPELMKPMSAPVPPEMPPGEAGDNPTTVMSSGSADDRDAAREFERLEVPIDSRSGSALVGTAELTEVRQGVKVVVRVDNAEPGLHGVHIHENADCSAPDASSAGGHYDPYGNKHGLPDDSQRHFGDLGNLGTAPTKGAGLLIFVVPNATLKEGPAHSLLNRALIVHADEDTGGQPSGSAGARIGCAELTREAAKERNTSG